MGMDVFVLLSAFDYHNGTVCFACAQHVAPDSCEFIELCSQDRVSFSLLPFQQLQINIAVSDNLTVETICYNTCTCKLYVIIFCIFNIECFQGLPLE